MLPEKYREAVDLAEQVCRWAASLIGPANTEG